MKLLSTDWQEDYNFGIFQNVVYVNSINEVKDADALVLWGGEDIGTEIYGQKANHYVFRTKKSERDIKEIAMVREAIKNQIPIIGICRGAQLLCALAGGSLVQHIGGHGHTHDVTLHDEENKVIQCNSSHHQMMLPPPNAKILATSKETSGVGQHNELLRIPKVFEVVYFPNMKGLGIQPHPEWTSCPQEFINYCVRKIKEYLL